MMDDKAFCYYNYYFDLKRKILKVEVKVLKDDKLIFNKPIGLLFKSYKDISGYIIKGIMGLLDEFKLVFTQYKDLPVEIKIREEDTEKLFNSIFMDIYNNEYFFTVDNYNKEIFNSLGNLDEEIKLIESKEPVNIDLDTKVITLKADKVEDITQTDEKKVKILLKDDYENIIFMDIETAHTSSNVKEIVALGAIKMDIKGEEIDAFHSLIKPEGEIIGDTKLKYEMLKDAEPFENIIQDFIYWVGKEKSLFMTWGEAIINIVLSECERSDIDCEIAYDMDNNYYDLQFEFSKTYFTEEKSISLDEALNLYNIEFMQDQNIILSNGINMLQLYKRCEK